MLPSRRPIIVLLLAATLALVAASCSSADDSAPATTTVDRNSAVDVVANDVIVPGYEQLAGETAALAEALDALCATPDAPTFDAARTDWDRAQQAWASTAANRLGPIRWQRLTADIEYPVDADKVDALAADGASPLTPEELDALGADVRGLNAVQQLLFGTDDVTGLTPRACSYAAAAATLSATSSAELLTAWTDGVDDEPAALVQMTEPGDDSMWSDTTEVLEDLLNTSLSALTTVADMQLGPATGETTEAPEPAEADPGPAQRARQDAQATIASVQAAWGRPSGDGAGGFAALVPPGVDDTMRTALSTALDQLDTVTVPIAQLDPADPDSPDMTALRTAYEQVVIARTALRTEVASQLGLTVAFSDADGDG
ncbi:MAG: imelysin family protein [Microthrixaceae bacterium]